MFYLLENNNIGICKSKLYVFGDQTIVCIECYEQFITQCSFDFIMYIRKKIGHSKKKNMITRAQIQTQIKGIVQMRFAECNIGIIYYGI